MVLFHCKVTFHSSSQTLVILCPPLHCIFNYFIVLLCCLSYIAFSTIQERQFIWFFSFTEVLIQMATEVVLLAGSPMMNSRYTNFKYIWLLLLSAQHLGCLPNTSLQTQGHTHGHTHTHKVILCHNSIRHGIFMTKMTLAFGILK